MRGAAVQDLSQPAAEVPRAARVYASVHDRHRKVPGLAWLGLAGLGWAWLGFAWLGWAGLEVPCLREEGAEATDPVLLLFSLSLSLLFFIYF